MKSFSSSWQFFFLQKKSLMEFGIWPCLVSEVVNNISHTTYKQHNFKPSSDVHLTEFPVYSKVFHSKKKPLCCCCLKKYYEPGDYGPNSIHTPTEPFHNLQDRVKYLNLAQWLVINSLILGRKNKESILLMGRPAHSSPPCSRALKIYRFASFRTIGRFPN